jgi:hypothetical protein
MVIGDSLKNDKLMAKIKKFAIESRKKFKILNLKVKFTLKLKLKMAGTAWCRPVVVGIMTWAACTAPTLAAAC